MATKFTPRMNAARAQMDGLRSTDPVVQAMLDATRRKREEEEKKRKKLVEDKLKEAKEFKDEDQKALDEAAIKVGIKFEYDDEGNITNYEETMSKLYAELDAAE